MVFFCAVKVLKRGETVKRDLEDLSKTTVS